MPVTLIITLIGLVANSVLSILTGQGVTSPALQTLITQLIALGGQLFSAFQSGSTAATEISSTLTTIEAALADVETDTNADPAVVSQVQELVKMLKAALAAEQNAEQVTDPSTLTPLPPVE